MGIDYSSLGNDTEKHCFVSCAISNHKDDADVINFIDDKGNGIRVKSPSQYITDKVLLSPGKRCRVYTINTAQVCWIVQIQGKTVTETFTTDKNHKLVSGVDNNSYTITGEPFDGEVEHRIDLILDVDPKPNIGKVSSMESLLELLLDYGPNFLKSFNEIQDIKKCNNQGIAEQQDTDLAIAGSQNYDIQRKLFIIMDGLNEIGSELTKECINLSLHKTMRVPILQSGSTVERVASSCFFREDDQSVDVDLMYIGATFDDQILENNIEEIQEKPGFVTLRYDEALLNCIKYIKSDIKEMQSKSTDNSNYLSAKLAREILPKYINLNQDNKDLLQKVVSTCTGKKQNAPAISVLEGPALNISIALKVDDRNVNLSVDNVGAIQCDFWPPIANAWKSRERPSSTPSKSLIDQIVREGCHLVAKSSSTDSPLEWRWSFSLAEKSLVEAQTPEQNQCYLIFRSLFYKHLKFRREEETLPSYLAKTVMLWVCEEKPVDSWNVPESVTDLVNKLERCFSEKRLSHYFIPEMNIFSYIKPESLLEEGHEIIKRMKEAPMMFLPPKDIFEMYDATISFLYNIFLKFCILWAKYAPDGHLRDLPELEPLLEEFRMLIPPPEILSTAFKSFQPFLNMLKMLPPESITPLIDDFIQRNPLFKPFQPLIKILTPEFINKLIDSFSQL